MLLTLALALVLMLMLMLMLPAAAALGPSLALMLPAAAALAPSLALLDTPTAPSPAAACRAARRFASRALPSPLEDTTLAEGSTGASAAAAVLSTKAAGAEGAVREELMLSKLVEQVEVLVLISLGQA